MLNSSRNLDGYSKNHFQVKWKGYPGEDTWEPLETVQKIEPFKDYVKKHKDVIQLSEFPGTVYLLLRSPWSKY